MAFATDRQSKQWADFRTHYPQCPECSEAVARIATLESAIAGQPGAGQAHFDESQMIAWVDGDLSATQRVPLEAHLAGCAACRTELAVLQTFEFAPEQSHSFSEAAGGADQQGWWGQLSETLGGLLQPAPGLALAAVIALGAWLLWSTTQPDSMEPPPRFTEEQAPEQAPSERRPGAHEDLPLIIEEGRPQLAEGTAPREPKLESPSPVGPNPAVPLPDPKSPSLRPEQLAESPDSRKEPAAPKDPRLTDEREVVLLAAHFPSEMPRYAAPIGFSTFDLEDVRIAGTVRAARADVPQISVLAPKHTGATASAVPRLYWVIDRRSDFPVEVVVNDPTARKTVLTQKIPAPVHAGTHVLDFEKEGLVLEEGQTLEWSVSLLPDASGEEIDVVSLGAVKRMPALPPEATSPEERARRIHRMASSGHWYDAYDALNAFLREAGDTDRLLEFRRALLDQVELAGVTDWLGREAP